jgi:hypothetical protein
MAHAFRLQWSLPARNGIEDARSAGIKSRLPYFAHGPRQTKNHHPDFFES